MRRQRTIAETVDSWISNVESEVVPAAEAMPADRFAFAPPVTLGQFDGVRTFAQQVKHVAANNYWMAAMIMHQKYGVELLAERGPDSVRTKQQIMDYLEGSFAALHAAAATINAGNVVDSVETPINWQRNRLSLAIDAIAHTYDHYGQLVEYLRMNGIVPPASRPKHR